MHPLAGRYVDRFDVEQDIRRAKALVHPRGVERGIEPAGGVTHGIAIAHPPDSAVLREVLKNQPAPRTAARLHEQAALTDLA